MKRKPGLSPSLAALGLAGFGYVGGASSYVLASLLGPVAGLAVLGATATLGLVLIVSGSKGVI